LDEGAVVQLLADLILGGKVGIEGGLGNPDSRSDLSSRNRMDSELAEQPQGRSQDLFPTLRPMALGLTG